jgi:hypothetical protein
MSLHGGASLKSLLHDLVESVQHRIDKLMLGDRRNYEFILLQKDRTFDFTNRFLGLESTGIYLLAPKERPAVHQGTPAEWDKNGTLASFSAGSEVARLRDFLLSGEGGKRNRRGKIAKSREEKDSLPPSPPKGMSHKFGPVKLVEVDSAKYLRRMLKVREKSHYYHRWVSGAGGRMYWQKCPVTTRQVNGDDIAVGALLEPLARASQMAEAGDEVGLRRFVEEYKEQSSDMGSETVAKVVKGTSDLRRYTVNVAPALARAMSLMLELGLERTVVRNLMTSTAPLIAAEFERVTGRKVVGVSVHFDSNLPHWNFWHSGLEAVIYKVGLSKRTRFRRTAMNLNSSGNMLAWDRVSQAFARTGTDFANISISTAKELEKAEKRARHRQGRSPGDFTLNRVADRILEDALIQLGHRKLVERGYQEFVANEKERYKLGLAGRDGKDLIKIVQCLAPAAGESPLEAAQRRAREREAIENALTAAPLRLQSIDMGVAVAHLASEVNAAESREVQIRATLEARSDESTADAALRVTRERDSFRAKAQRLFEYLQRLVKSFHDLDALRAVLREVADEFKLTLQKPTKEVRQEATLPMRH